MITVLRRDYPHSQPEQESRFRARQDGPKHCLKYSRQRFTFFQTNAQMLRRSIWALLGTVPLTLGLGPFELNVVALDHVGELDAGGF